MVSVLNNLEENDRYVFLEVTKILLRILDNVIKAPENPKYRKLQLKSETISKKLIPAIGAMECLFEFGFQEADDSLVLPPTTSLTKIKNMREKLHKLRENYLKKIGANSSISKEPTSKYPFLEEIRVISRNVLQYEDKQLQAKARSKIPIDELKRKVEKKVREKSTEFDQEFGLLFEMMIWFKTEFFQWMNNPICKKCDSSSTFQGYSKNPEDFINTDRVEVYFCDKCDARLLFPRYNDPVELLETRTGRCGEWANCFTLFCRTLGYEARYILDKTDHVWTEVYSKSLKRWIHCDPCEGTIDAPLMYEKGWGKQLTYVIAFSNEEVQDVTWRYTTQFSEIRTRRKLCRENALLNLILTLSDQLQADLPEERKKYLCERRLEECVEFLTPPHSDKQYGGRMSGSLQWRLSRRECEIKANKRIWIPNKAEIERRKFVLKYSTSKDKYFRDGTDGENEIINGWEHGVYELESVFRKVETDWKMCYLCRCEGTSNGTIKWQFCVEKQGVIIERVKITYQCSTFHSGCARLILCNEETCIPLKITETVIDTDAFRGSHDLSLTAVLNGGSGPSSWQHAQLFRQSVDDDSCPFVVEITFSPE